MKLAYSFLILTSVGTGVFSTARARAEDTAPSVTTWESLVMKIQPGLTRADVEAWLNERDGGPQGINSTRYVIQPDIIVEVPYDQTGGTWTSENRVSAPVRVIRSSLSSL